MPLYRTWLWRAATVLWAVQITLLSTNDFNSSSSRSRLALLLAALHIHLAPALQEAIHMTIRKSAHALEYALLGFLLYRSMNEPRPLAWRPRLAALALAVCALFALGDEFHQLFEPDRGASLLDAAIDFAGSAAALYALYLYCRRSARLGLSHA